MAQATRTVCVFIPFLLILATLIVLILIFTGNTSTSTVARDLYFVKMDTSNFTIVQAAGIKLKSWYTVGLWNYCSGPAGTSVATHCSKHKAFFWFNPVRVFHLEADSAILAMLAPEAAAALAKYQTACKWLFCAYIGAIGASIATLVVSACAFCRRLGSLVASVVAAATAIFSVGAAVTATIIYMALVAFIKSNFGANGLEASLGTAMFALVWLAAALSVLACVFFLATACCCAGDSSSSRSMRRRPDEYEKVPSPYPSGSPLPPQGFGQSQYQPVPMHAYHHHEQSI